MALVQILQFLVNSSKFRIIFVILGIGETFSVLLLIYMPYNLNNTVKKSCSFLISFLIYCHYPFWLNLFQQSKLCFWKTLGSQNKWYFTKVLLCALLFIILNTFGSLKRLGVTRPNNTLFELTSLSLVLSTFRFLRCDPLS